MYAYNEKILQGSIQPSLVDMFIDKANSFDDKVGIFFFIIQMGLLWLLDVLCIEAELF